MKKKKLMKRNKQQHKPSGVRVVTFDGKVSGLKGNLVYYV